MMTPPKSKMTAEISVDDVGTFRLYESGLSHAVSDGLGEHDADDCRARRPPDRSRPVRSHESTTNRRIRIVCHAFMQRHGKQDRARQDDAENCGSQPCQPHACPIGATDEEHEGRHTLDRHGQTHHPCGAALVFDRNFRRPVDPDGREQRVVDQLDEPNDTHHDARRHEIQNQLQHAETLRQPAALWLTERMSDSDSHAHHDHADKNHGSYGRNVQEGLAPITRELRELIPDVYKGFGGLHAAAFRAGALDAKSKELIALAIAITTHCDGCIAAHAKGAARNGATEAEVAEMIGVAISMNGGPGTVYGPRAFAAFREFKNA